MEEGEMEENPDGYIQDDPAPRGEADNPTHLFRHAESQLCSCRWVGPSASTEECLRCRGVFGYHTATDSAVPVSDAGNVLGWLYMHYKQAFTRI